MARVAAAIKAYTGGQLFTGNGDDTVTAGTTLTVTGGGVISTDSGNDTITAQTAISAQNTGSATGGTAGAA